MDESSRRRFLRFCTTMGMSSVFTQLLVGCGESTGSPLDTEPGPDMEGEGSGATTADVEGLSILQNPGIQFTPAMPPSMQSAIESIEIWGGFKAFFEFSEPFYDGYDAFDVPAGAGHKLYYEASWGQDSPHHIYALFCVGEPSLEYTSRSGNELRDFILSELDDLYAGQASATYVKHVTKDWTNDEFARGAYLADGASWDGVVGLPSNLDDRVFFAGSAFTDGEDWGSVHNAARSALVAAAALVSSARGPAAG